LEIIGKILGFITDSNKRLSSRATVFLLSLMLLVLGDNITGFSSYYNKSRQLEQLSLITELLKEPNISLETRNRLIELEENTLKRKNILDHFFSFVKSISWKSAENSINEISDSEDKKNNLWFLFSSSGIYILVALVLIPVMIFTDKETPFLTLIATIFLFLIIMFFASWFNFWLFDKIIPNRIFGSWKWNYAFNFIIQILLIIAYLKIETYLERWNKT